MICVPTGGNNNCDNSKVVAFIVPGGDSGNDEKPGLTKMIPMKSNLTFAILALSGFFTAVAVAGAKAQPVNYRPPGHLLGGPAGNYYCPPTKATGNKVAPTKGPVITVGSPVIDLNLAVVTQNGGSNAAVVKQGNLGQVGVNGAHNGINSKNPVYTVGSAVINVNIATVTQIGGTNVAIVNQGNLGQIGIGNTGFIDQ